MQSVTGSGRVVAGRYELLNAVGHGAMGTVWRARDQLLDREVAVKEVRVPGPMTYQDRNVLRERSMREARVAARLSHPGVVTVHDVIEAGGTPWIIMELVPSRSLAQVLAEDGPLPPARAAMMGMTLLEALGTAHAAGVVHRDVKPGNILITPDGRAVLTDFGIATLHGDPGLTQAGMVMGTPGFCAPERIRGQPASPASDLWSLGATLYAAVEGRGPFEGQGSAMAVLANIVHGDPPPAKSAGPLGPVIAALMRRDPAVRPDAAAARRLLAAACSGYDTGTAAQPRSSVGAHSSAPAASAAQGGAATLAGSTAAAGAGALAGSAAPAGAAALAGSAGPGGASALVSAQYGSGARDGTASERPAGGVGVPGESGAAGPAGLASTLAFPAAAPDGAAAFAGQPLATTSSRATGTVADPDLTVPAPRGPEAAGAGLAGAGLAGAGLAGAGLAGAVAAGMEYGTTVTAQGPPGTAATTPAAPPGSPASPGSPAPGGKTGPGGQRRRPGRHRRALLFGGGGTAIVLASLLVAMGLAHAARLHEIRRTAASSPLPPAIALPAGYHWYTARALSAPRRAGFSIAVADGWRTRQHGDTTLMRNPVTDATITVTRAAPDGPGPLREAASLASASHGSFPGYHQIALLPIPFHGTLAGAWRFAYQRPGAGNEQVLELVARLDTKLGTQPYELTVTSPRRAWLASRAAFGAAMDAFTPQS
jgi:tRNA A-37 threonylcarbamoyl transferase component Bud32